MIFPLSDESPLFHDLTGPHGCSLLPVAGEMREREARRAARAGRWRRSWLRKAGCWVGSIGRRGDRPRTGLPAANSAAGGVDPNGSRDPLPDILDELGVHGLLTVARATALREQRPDLAAAIHSVLLLDMTGNLDDMAALVAAVQETYRTTLGDGPRAVN